MMLYLSMKKYHILIINNSFFLFYLFHSNFFTSSQFSLFNSMEFEIILGLGLIGLFFLIISNDFILFFPCFRII